MVRRGGLGTLKYELGIINRVGCISGEISHTGKKEGEYQNINVMYFLGFENEKLFE